MEHAGAPASDLLEAADADACCLQLGSKQLRLARPAERAHIQCAKLNPVSWAQEDTGVWGVKTSGIVKLCVMPFLRPVTMGGGACAGLWRGQAAVAGDLQVQGYVCACGHIRDPCHAWCTG